MAVGLLLWPAPPAHADVPPASPYIDHTAWVRYDGKSSLRVYPTRAGRKASGPAAIAQGAQAWSEVLHDAPDADTPGMQAQFLCHWYFAEAASPGKVSWNLEPWRPVVDDAAMVSAKCNPGGEEEPF